MNRADVDASIRAATGYYAEEPDGELAEMLRAIWNAALEAAAGACEGLDAGQEAEWKANANYHPAQSGWRSQLAQRCAAAVRALKGD